VSKAELLILSSRELWLTVRGFSRYHDTLPFPDAGLRDWLDASGYHARTHHLTDRAPVLVGGTSVTPPRRRKRKTNRRYVSPVSAV